MRNCELIIQHDIVYLMPQKILKANIDRTFHQRVICAILCMALICNTVAFSFLITAVDGPMRYTMLAETEHEVELVEIANTKELHRSTTWKSLIFIDDRALRLSFEIDQLQAIHYPEVLTPPPEMI